MLQNTDKEYGSIRLCGSAEHTLNTEHDTFSEKCTKRGLPPPTGGGGVTKTLHCVQRHPLSNVSSSVCSILRESKKQRQWWAHAHQWLWLILTSKRIDVGCMLKHRVACMHLISLRSDGVAVLIRSCASAGGWGWGHIRHSPIKYTVPPWHREVQNSRLRPMEPWHQHTCSPLGVEMWGLILAHRKGEERKPVGYMRCNSVA